MPENIDLGTMTIVSHDEENITEALGIPHIRFKDLVDLAETAWEEDGTISEAIEYIAKNVSGSELVMAMIFFGRIWENQSEDEEDPS